MNVFEKVSSILSELTGTQYIESNSSLQDDLGMDSFQMVSLLIEIEDAFNITLDESDMNPFDLNTVQDLVDLVTRYRSHQHETQE